MVFESIRKLIPTSIKRRLLEANPILVGTTSGAIFPPLFARMVKVLKRDLVLYFFYIDVIDCIREVFIENVYDKGLKISKGDIVIDVGANVGMFTVKAAKQVGNSGLVIAIEPAESNLNLLKKNIELNKFKNVITIPKAVGSLEGNSKFYISKHSATHSMVLMPFNQEIVKNEIEVEVDTLDNIAQQLNLKKIDFVKMDAEGAELTILKGAEKSLKIIKHLAIGAEHYDNQAEELKQFLEERGFTAWAEGEMCYANR